MSNISALNVNGKKLPVDVDAQTSLLMVLRNNLNLTGTKYGCGEAQCGACTVLIDGQPTRSCVTNVGRVADKQITTIEGLEKDGQLHPLQDAFLKADALQCGYCTSGMVLSCKTLLDATPKPSRDEIRTAIAGNLCRCGTYNHVFAAVERAAGMRTASHETAVDAYAALAPHALSLDSDPRVSSGTAEALEAEEV